MIDRAHVIAGQARRFRLLADRVELLYPDRERRIKHATEPTRNTLDTLLAGGASESDRICAAAVRMLREPKTRRAELLDLLGTLSPDNLLGIYFALPPDRRAVLESDPVWAYHVQRAPEVIAEAEADLDYIASRCGPDPEAPPEALAYRTKVHQRMLGLGAEVEMSPLEEACMIAGERFIEAVNDD